MENSGVREKQKALSEILILTGLCLIGMLVFSGLAIYLVQSLTGMDASDMLGFMNPEKAGENGRSALLVMQGLIASGSFILFPLLIRFISPPSPEALVLKPSGTLLLMLVALSLLMMPVNAWLAAWNQSIRLPSFMQGFQSWAWTKEKEMEKLTSFLVDFSGWQEGLLGFLVIAVLAGLTEEFFFRRMLQPRIIKLTGNPHAGIWLTAFIFSAIHIQFYGLFPRMVLGGLFGYYFYWTGNILLPVLAHVLNNGITLLGLVLYQQKMSPVNVENPDEIPWYLGAIAAGVVWSLSSMFREEALKIRKSSILPTTQHE
jgi:membrane protease YdiL (CAAX protease family)